MQLLTRLQETPTPKNYSQYQSAPARFARVELGSAITDLQAEIMEAVRDYKIVVVKSANAVGKTFTAADVSLWFLRSFPRSKVITSAAPPLENLERLMWGEIGQKLIKNSTLFEDAKIGYLNIEFGPDWWMNGVAIPTSGTPAQREAKFSGKHAPHLLFIVDEGDAVPDEVYRGIESCMSGGDVHLLVLFNPREQTGPVYRMIQAGAHVIELDAFSHPNVVTGQTLVPGAVSREITVERIINWSRPEVEGDKPDVNDPDWFTVPDYLDGATVPLEDGTQSPPLVGDQWRHVTNPALSYMTLARFPGQSETQLISRAWVEAAQQRWLLWQAQYGDNPPAGVRPMHGQDVAEFGADSNVACFRYGSYVAAFAMWSGVDVLETGDRAARMAQDKNAEASFADATGVGSGVAPQMMRWWSRNRRGDYNGRATPVKVAESPTATAQEGEFGILRDQLWWAVREWLRTDTGAMLPPDAQLADELCAPRYQIRRGKIKVDDKDALRKRLHRSPDKADALCLTFAKRQQWGIA